MINVHIIEWSIDGYRKCSRDTFYVSKEEVSRSKRYVFDEDRASFLIARTFIRKLSSVILKKSPNEIHLKIDINGRPYIDNCPEYLDFNISRSKNYIAIAMSDSCKVGIDIERIRNIDIDEIMDNFTNHAKNYIYSHRKESLITTFYKFWTAYESSYKMTGKGIANSDPRKIDFYNQNNKLMFDVSGIKAVVSTFSNDRIVYSVASNKDNQRISITFHYIK